MKKTIPLFVLLILLLAITLTASAQELSKPASLMQEGSSSLNSLLALPEADTLVYINTERILNDAIPKFMPAKDVADMRKAFEDVKKSAGIDPSKVEYFVIATRFRKPSADLTFVLPEFIAMAVGDFSADSLVTLAHLAAQGKLRDEKYGSKTIGLMTIDPIVKEAEKNPILKSVTEIGIVAVSPNTILIGSPAYLRAAIDSSSSNKRIDPERLRSLLRDPEVLISIAGTPRMAFNKSFGILGVGDNDRPAKCESRLGDFYISLNMDATNLMLRGIMNADNPDTAKIIRNLINGLIAQVSSIADKEAQPALKTINIATEGDEVVLSADVPQQMVLDLIKQKMTPKKQEETTVMKPTEPAKKRTPVRRKRRTTKH